MKRLLLPLIVFFLLALTNVPVFARTPCASPLAGTLAGLTKGPGFYCLSAEAKTGTLILDARGNTRAIWTFQIDGGLTGTSFHVVMAGGGQACNVSWLATAATMTDSDMKGIIHADSAITLTRGTLVGAALAPHITNTSARVTGCAPVVPVAPVAPAAPAVPAAHNATNIGLGLLILLIILALAAFLFQRRRISG